jgi:hypothetical protein
MLLQIGYTLKLQIYLPAAAYSAVRNKGETGWSIKPRLYQLRLQLHRLVWTGYIVSFCGFTNYLVGKRGRYGYRAISEFKTTQWDIMYNARARGCADVIALIIALAKSIHNRNNGSL